MNRGKKGKKKENRFKVPSRNSRPSKENKEMRNAHKARFMDLYKQHPVMMLCDIDSIPCSLVDSFRTSLQAMGGNMMFIKHALIRAALKDISLKLPRAKKTLQAINDLSSQSVCVFLQNFAQIDLVTNWSAQHTFRNNTPPPGVIREDVIVPAGSTGLDPTNTALFQMVGIATKIRKAVIEIVNPSVLAKRGEHISADCLRLINKMNLRPFRYAIKPGEVSYKDVVFNCKDINEARKEVLRGLRQMQALSVETGLYNPLSGPYYVVKGLANLRGVVKRVNEDLLGPRELPPRPPPLPVTTSVRFANMEHYGLDILFGANN